MTAFLILFWLLVCVLIIACITSAIACVRLWLVERRIPIERKEPRYGRHTRIL